MSYLSGILLLASVLALGQAAPVSSEAQYVSPYGRTLYQHALKKLDALLDQQAKEQIHFRYPVADEIAKQAVLNLEDISAADLYSAITGMLKSPQARKQWGVGVSIPFAAEQETANRAKEQWGGSVSIPFADNQGPAKEQGFTLNYPLAGEVTKQGAANRAKEQWGGSVSIPFADNQGPAKEQGFTINYPLAGEVTKQGDSYGDDFIRDIGNLIDSFSEQQKANQEAVANKETSAKVERFPWGTALGAAGLLLG